MIGGSESDENESQDEEDEPIDGDILKIDLSPKIDYSFPK